MPIIIDNNNVIKEEIITIRKPNHIKVNNDFSADKSLDELPFCLSRYLILNDNKIAIEKHIALIKIKKVNIFYPD